MTINDLIKMSPYAIPGLRGTRRVEMADYPHYVIDSVCHYLGVDKEKVVCTGRKGDIILARHIIMYALKKKTPMSLCEIGKVFKGNTEGRKHHTTVIHGIKTLQNRMDTEETIFNLVHDIMQEI